MIGTTLAGYRIVEQVGKGGMATVYKAFDPLAERYVAIKTLPPYYLDNETFRARFEQEAKSIAQLEHIHILPMFAYGEENSVVYMIMRYLETGTLAEYIYANGQLAFAEATHLLTQIAAALYYAHTHHILHRDVKPSNILLDNQGNALLTDFGIAKMIDGSGLDLTGTGLIGTPKYMSPEQCKGEQILTPFSDQYSLGIVLYEMLTGQAPFDAETPLAVIQQHVNAPLPPPRNLRADLPEAAQNVIFKALARNPQARYQNCIEFAQAFSNAISKLDSSTANISNLDNPTVIFANSTTSTQNDETYQPNVAKPSVFREKPPHRASRLSTISFKYAVLGFTVLCTVVFFGILLINGNDNSAQNVPEFLLTDTASPDSQTAVANAQTFLTIVEEGQVLFENEWSILQTQISPDTEPNWLPVSGEEMRIEGDAPREESLVAYLGNNDWNNTVLRFEFLPRSALQSGTLAYIRANEKNCQRYELDYALESERLAQLSIWQVNECPTNEDAPLREKLGSLAIPAFRQFYWYEVQVFIVDDSLFLTAKDMQGSATELFQQIFVFDLPLETGQSAVVVPTNDTFWYRVIYVAEIALQN